MNHPQSFVHAAHARGSVSRPVVLILLLAQVAATGCQPEPTPTDTDPTSAHTLVAAPIDEADANPPQQVRSFHGVLTPTSLFGGQYFRYDAFVLTALESGPVTISSDVIEVNPNGYVNGYGYPLTIAAIEEGVTFTFVGGEYIQNALETGTAVIQYPVEARRQYVLVYKTFDSFTPLEYRLRIPPSLKMEGRIELLPAAVPVTGDNTRPISLENPRPILLSHIIDWLRSRVGL